MLFVGMLCQAAFSQVATADRSVSGESWLKHLQRSFNETSMGKTGDLGPAVGAADPVQVRWSPSLTTLGIEKLTVHGSDLYRFNCRGCHGESGLGSPPEIHSVINPVRATSAELLVERMKSSGMDVSRADAAQMAKQARDAISMRFQKGGESMPSFANLQPSEERLVIAYLNQLARVPGGSSAQSTLTTSRLRVGELIVKSTCHICHDATGANPDPQEILQGAIPPLSTLTARTTEVEFIRKVTHGAPVLMGNPAEAERGRMPVFYYLSEDEAADVYQYLLQYPPRNLAASDEAVVAEDRRNNNPMIAASVGRVDPPSQPPEEDMDGRSLVVIGGLAALVMGLLFAGMAITILHFRRLSAHTESVLVPDDIRVPVMQV
jgi:mono/diheme cytochrome c family protein